MMGRSFDMYAIIRMHTEILSYSRATHISWMEDDTDGLLLKVFACFVLAFRIQPIYHFVESVPKQ